MLLATRESIYKSVGNCGSRNLNICPDIMWGAELVSDKCHLSFCQSGKIIIIDELTLTHPYYSMKILILYIL
jgi:hypothetical protein